MFVQLMGFAVGGFFWRLITNFYRIGSALDVDDRDGRIVRECEVFGESLGVDRRRCDDQFEVFSFAEDPFEIAK